MLSHEGKGRDVTRPELVEKHGYDTKFAAHMVRLGYQGVELLETGRFTLPLPASVAGELAPINGNRMVRLRRLSTRVRRSASHGAGRRARPGPGRR
jgi:hypothetical protein